MRYLKKSLRLNSVKQRSLLKLTSAGFCGLCVFSLSDLGSSISEGSVQTLFDIYIYAGNASVESVAWQLLILSRKVGLTATKHGVPTPTKAGAVPRAFCTLCNCLLGLDLLVLNSGGFSTRNTEQAASGPSGAKINFSDFSFSSYFSISTQFSFLLSHYIHGLHSNLKITASNLIKTE